VTCKRGMAPRNNYFRGAKLSALTNTIGWKASLETRERLEATRLPGLYSSLPGSLLGLSNNVRFSLEIGECME
jgi:hypothetical protein